MIKGHLEIELHNHKTGLKDKIEQDNLVTNAVNHLTDYIMGRDGTESKILPIYTKALGGILIFEDPLTESANNITFPIGNFLTGYAGRTLNTDDAQRGSINNIDSCEVPGGYMTVWDFATSQANGPISSMALTHSSVDGYSPINGYMMSTFQLNYKRQLLKYDDEYLYYADLTTGNFIKACYLPSRNYKVTDSFGLKTDLYEVVEEGVFSASQNEWIDGFDGKYYSVLNSSSKTNKIFHLDIIAIDKLTYQRYGTFHIEIEAADSAYEHFNNVDANWKNIGTDRGYCVSNGILYVSEIADITNAGTTVKGIKIYGIDLNAVSLNPQTKEATVELDESDAICDIIDPDLYDASQCVRMLQSPDGAAAMRYTTNIQYGSARYQRWGAVRLNGDYKLYSRLCEYSNPMSESLHYMAHNNDIIGFRRWQNNTYATIDANYLGTICNLEAPFEKTVSTSMKVKYTLTNV